MTHTLTRGATIYELTAEERATMKRLIDAGLVVGIGEHAVIKRDRAELIEALQDSVRQLRASLPYWQTDKDGIGPDCAPILQSLIDSRALLERMKP